MQSSFKKIFGISIITLAIIGMIFSAVGAVGICIVLKISLDVTIHNLIVTVDSASVGLSIV